MFESLFYSSDVPNREIVYNLYYIFILEFLIWYIFFNAIFPYGIKIKMRFEKLFGISLSLILTFCLLILFDLQLYFLGNDYPSLSLNTELLSMISGFLLTQFIYIESEKTIFRKKIRKKEIRWFTSKK